MSKLRIGLVALAGLLPVAATADVDVGDLPPDTVWYVHVDLEQLRTSESGQVLNRFMQWEVYDEIDEELGIDLNKEVDQFTAFSDSENGTAIIIDGPVTDKSRERILELIDEEEGLEPRKYKRFDYYHVGDEEKPRRDSDEPFDDLDDTAYFSFALDDRILITGTEAYMQDLLDNKGRVPGAGNHNGALLVLSANKSLVQAGLQTDGVIDEDDDDDWESNIVRNTEQAALLMADESGQLAVEAQLVSTDPKMAEAIAGIVNGLIALQAFNSELGPEIQSLMQNTRVEVMENILSINLVIDPNLVVSVIEN